MIESNPETSARNDIGHQNLDKVYGEASQWVRFANDVIWKMAAVFVTASVALIGVAIQKPALNLFCALSSVFLFSVWVYLSHLYGATSSKARDVLMQIETTWTVPRSMALYVGQGQVAKKPFSLPHVQNVSLAALILFWILFLAFIK